MRNRLLLKFVVTLGCAAGLLAGCKSSSTTDDGPSMIKPVGQRTANELNAENSNFESSDDPPINANTRFAAGQLAESQNSPQQAAQQYEEALKLNPKFEAAAYRLGVVYAQVRNFPEAINAWQYYVKLTSGSATALGNLGFCYELAGQRDKAVDAYQQGIAKDPQNQLCRINYGLLLARAGKSEEAIAQLQAVLSPAEAHYNLASVYEQQGKTSQAREQYAKALELDPQMWEAQSRMQALK